MRNIKLTAIIILYLLTQIACFTAAVHAKTAVTIYGDDNYPPYSYMENGQQRGIYYELLQVAVARMPDYAVTIKLVPWKRGLMLLESGQGFALFPPYQLQATRPYIEPYSVPFNEESVIVVCRNGIPQNKPDAVWPEDYRGLIFGTNMGFHMGLDSFWQEVKAGRITVDYSPGTTCNVKKLVEGRIDCYLNDRLAILFEYSREITPGPPTQEDRQKLPFSFGPVVAKFSAHLGYNADNRLYPFKDDFVRKLDTILMDMEKQGAMDRLIRKYLW
ncbi:MAG: substrate-binding periplasmic protein [Halodesulfovibrio sp.]